MYHSTAGASSVNQAPCQADDLERRRPIVHLKDTALAYRPQAGISRSHAYGTERATELDALPPSNPTKAPSTPSLKELSLQVPILAPHQVIFFEDPQLALSIVSSDPKGQEERSASASTVSPAQHDSTTSQAPRLRNNSTEHVPIPTHGISRLISSTTRPHPMFSRDILKPLSNRASQTDTSSKTTWVSSGMQTAGISYFVS